MLSAPLHCREIEYLKTLLKKVGALDNNGNVCDRALIENTSVDNRVFITEEKNENIYYEEPYNNSNNRNNVYEVSVLNSILLLSC